MEKELEYYLIQDNWFLINRFVNILNIITKGRFNNTDSAFYYHIGDDKNNYILPSTYGWKIKGGISRALYILDPGATWNNILKLSWVKIHIKINSTRQTFTTNFYRVIKDLKALETNEAQAKFKLSSPIKKDNDLMKISTYLILC